MVALFAVALCAVIGQFGMFGRQATLSWPSQPESDPVVQPSAIGRVHDAPFTNFRHRRSVAAKSPAASLGDAAHDHDLSIVRHDEPVQPARPSCSTRTYKVPSESGGEASVSVMHCNGR